jgi:hypothetical protein
VSTALVLDNFRARILRISPSASYAPPPPSDSLSLSLRLQNINWELSNGQVLVAFRCACLTVWNNCRAWHAMIMLLQGLKMNVNDCKVLTWVEIIAKIYVLN